MDNKKRMIPIAIILLLSIGNFYRITENEQIRAIQFVNIFTIGFLSAILISYFIKIYREKNK